MYKLVLSNTPEDTSLILPPLKFLFFTAISSLGMIVYKTLNWDSNLTSVIQFHKHGNSWYVGKMR